MCLRDKNGKNYKKSVMLYGYYGMNLGDDLFFEKLLTRYPDVMFFVYFSQNYRAFFEKYDNVKFYAIEDDFVRRINQIGTKVKIRELFELLLLMRSDATVHIGGSIYQQVGDYNLDYNMRKRRKQPFKPFFSISCNFGTFKDQTFKNMWRRQFVKYKDICFRDKYSYNLFSDIKAVRYAPDLLFSYKKPDAAEIAGSVAISVFNPFLEIRKISPAVGEAYRATLVKTICDLVSQGRQVSLVGFCTFEGDSAFIDDLLEHIPLKIREYVCVKNYSFETKQDIINLLASSEYIIGTRLHSIILGLAWGKKVIPIIYNSKIKHILCDIKYNQLTIDLDEISKYAQSGLAQYFGDISPFDANELSNSDELQFERLDKFLLNI